jgi:hypothetical protein
VGWLQDHRDRKAFDEALAAEVERLTPVVAEARSALEAGDREVRQLIGRLPGATPRCEHCAGPLKLERHKWGRGKNQWESGWYCTRCGRRQDTEDVHGSWQEPGPVGASSA